MIDDEELSHLTNLKELDLSETPFVTGSCFTSFTSLEVLKIGVGVPISDVSLVSLASTLKSLSLYRCTTVNDRSISKMISLESLSLIEYSFLTDTAICTLTRLTVLDIYDDNPSITDKGLCNLCCLASFSTYAPHPLLTIAGLYPSRETIRHLDCPDLFSSLLATKDFPLLEHVSIFEVDPAEEDLRKELESRGVYVDETV